jgi:hypothetical protein
MVNSGGHFKDFGLPEHPAGDAYAWLRRRIPEVNRRALAGLPEGCCFEVEECRLDSAIRLYLCDKAWCRFGAGLAKVLVRPQCRCPVGGVSYVFRGCKVTGCYCVKRAGRLLIVQALFPAAERSLFTKWTALVANLDFESCDVVLEVVAAAQFGPQQTPWPAEFETLSGTGPRVYALKREQLVPVIQPTVR